jgi:hypothetical protein
MDLIGGNRLYQMLYNKLQYLQCCLVYSQHNYWYYMFQTKRPSSGTRALTTPLLCLPTLASVYTLGVCWTGVLSL